MAITQLFPSKDIAGLLADYPSKASVPTFSDKVTILSPPSNYPNSEYLRTGLSAIMVGSGGNVTATGLPNSQMGIFIEEPVYIQDSVGGDPSKYLPTFTRTQSRFAVDNWVTARNGLVKYVVDSIESGHAAFNWRPSWAYAPTQCEDMAQRWAELMDPIGGYYGGEYGGSFDAANATANFANIADLIPGLTSFNAALTYLKAHESNDIPYFRSQVWRYHGALHKTYYRAHLTPMDNLFTDLIGFQLWYNAMRSTEVNGGPANRKLCGFSMHEGSEFMGYTDLAVVPVENNGTVVHNAFPAYSLPYHQARAFLHSQACDIKWGWGDLQRYGNDPKILCPLNDYYRYTGSGVGVTFKGTDSTYHADGAGFVGKYLGNNNGDYEGNKWYAEARNWVDSPNWAWTRFRPVGGSYPTLNGEYLARRRQEGGGMANIMQKPGSSKRHVFFIPPNPGVYQEWDIDALSGETITKGLIGGIPYRFKLD